MQVPLAAQTVLTLTSSTDMVYKARYVHLLTCYPAVVEPILVAFRPSAIVKMIQELMRSFCSS